MSSYRAAAYHPVEDVVRTAWWLDDYFGNHRFGVRFDGTDEVYQPNQVQIPLDVVFVRKP